MFPPIGSATVSKSTCERSCEYSVKDDVEKASSQFIHSYVHRVETPPVQAQQARRGRSVDDFNGRERSNPLGGARAVLRAASATKAATARHYLSGK